MEPVFKLKKEDIDNAPIRAVNLFKMCGLCKSVTEARNIASQKGLLIIDDEWCPQGLVVEPDDLFFFTDFPCVLRRGKKHHCQIIVEEGNDSSMGDTTSDGSRRDCQQLPGTEA